MFAHSARIKRFISKALIVKHGYSLVYINNAAYEPVKLALWGVVKKVITLKLTWWRILHLHQFALF